MQFSPLLRQVFVAVGAQLGSVSLGGSLGYPSVLLQQLQSNDSQIRPDLDTMTWITSMHGIAGLGAILMPTIMQLRGRKFAFIGSCLLLIIGWSLIVAAKDAYTVLLAEAFLGLGSNCIAVVNLMTTSEMLAPKYRTVSMMLLGISQSVGMIIVTTTGTLIHWQKLALVTCTPLILTVVMACMWPESPAWLIHKGELEKGEKVFIWLRGTDEDAKQELDALIVAYREKQRKPKKKLSWRDMCCQIKMKDFYLPSLHMFLLLFNFYISGGICLVVYSRYLIKIATGDEESALFGYLMISVTFVFGAVFSLVCIRYLNSKTILYIGATCNVFLLAGSVVLILNNFGVISTNSYIFVSIYLGITLCYDSGFNTITFAVAIELMPVKHRGLGGALYNIFTCILYFCTVKSLPYMILYLNIWGVLILFSVSGIICTLLIWRYVPEPKGRTLQEIEDYYNYGSFVKHEVDKEEITAIVKSD